MLVWVTKPFLKQHVFIVFWTETIINLFRFSSPLMLHTACTKLLKKTLPLHLRATFVKVFKPLDFTPQFVILQTQTSVYFFFFFKWSSQQNAYFLGERKKVLHSAVLSENSVSQTASLIGFIEFQSKRCLPHYMRLSPLSPSKRTRGSW